VCIWQSSSWYTALMSLGMKLIRANTLAFGLIGKDGPHKMKKKFLGNMNLVFGSEVALLGFWEYMFQILFRVNARIQSLKTSVLGLFFFVKTWSIISDTVFYVAYQQNTCQSQHLLYSNLPSKIPQLIT
jgi:hypothetical protein